jgi:hypothetical protein
MWRASAKFGGLVFFFFVLEIQFRAPIRHFLIATWKPMTGPCGIQSLSHSIHLHIHPATFRTVCHVVVQTTTWHFLIGPHVDLKMSKTSDTWQPLVMPHHHDDVSMTYDTLYMCHVYCTDADIICMMLTSPVWILTHPC